VRSARRKKGYYNKNHAHTIKFLFFTSLSLTLLSLAPALSKHIKLSAAYTIVNTAHAQAGYLIDSTAAATMVCITPARRDVLLRQREFFPLSARELVTKTRGGDVR
jgi:hypothetical protein